jgi:hypothetical protein
LNLSGVLFVFEHVRLAALQITAPAQLTARLHLVQITRVRH